MYLLVKGADSELFREKLLAAGAAEAVAKALVKFSEVRSPSYQPDSVSPCAVGACFIGGAGGAGLLPHPGGAAAAPA